MRLPQKNFYPTRYSHFRPPYGVDSNRVYSKTRIKRLFEFFLKKAFVAVFFAHSAKNTVTKAFFKKSSKKPLSPCFQSELLRSSLCLTPTKVKISDFNKKTTKSPFESESEAQLDER